MLASKKLALVLPGCVACGSCEKACPLGAIKVVKGIRALVNEGACIGCGKCEKACPAGIIAIKPREVVA